MPRAEINDEGRIDVDTAWAEKDLIKLIPGASYNDKRKVWTVPLSWASCQQLRGVFAHKLEIGAALHAWATREKAERVDPSVALRNVLTMDGPAAYRPYQIAGSMWLTVAGDCLLADEPGTGKTVQSLSAARSLGAENSLPMLIVCPNSVKHHWARHFKGDPVSGTLPWFPEATPYIIGGGATKRRKLLDEASQDPTAAVIINYQAVRLHTRLAPYGAIRLRRCEECGGVNGAKDDDGVWRDEFGAVMEPGTTAVTPSRCEVHLKELNHIAFKIVIGDELHSIKDPSAKQTRAVWHVMHQPSVERRWGLTGTPLANHVGDLWSAMHGVSPAEYVDKSDFIERYALFTWNDHGGLDISDVRPDTKEEFFRFLDPRMRRMLKAIVLPQLPPKVWSSREAQMTTKQAKMYTELEDQMYTRTSDGRLLLTTNNLVKNLRLIQLASSSAEIEELDELDEEGNPKTKVVLHEPSSKLDVLDELVDEYEGRQITVSAMSRQLIELAATRLEARGISIVQLTGKVPEWDRRRNLDDFQAGRARVLLFTLGAGGVGIDMTASDTMIRLQRSYSMIENVQGLGRVDRIGAEVHESLHIIDVIAPDTVEEDQLERIREKEERLETIVRDRARLALAGEDTGQLDAEYAEIMTSGLLPPMEEQ